jgi:choline dehydrogenase
VDAIRFTRRIMGGAGEAPAGGIRRSDFKTDIALMSVAGDLGTTIFHLVGTCRMGRRTRGRRRPSACAASPAARNRCIGDAAHYLRYTNALTTMIAEKALSSCMKTRRSAERPMAPSVRRAPVCRAVPS